MAKVNAKVVGGDIQEIEAQTVGDLKTRLSVSTHTALVNGQPAKDDTVLKDEDFISLAPPVKGAI